VGLGLLVPAARGGIIVDVDSLTGGWSTSGNGILSNPDGPHFGSIPPALGVQGFKMSGVAEMSAQGDSDDPAAVELAFQGDAEGTITNSVVLVNLQGAYKLLTSSPNPRTLTVRMMLDLAVVDGQTGLAQDAILDTSFEFTIDESMVFPFNHQFTFDLSDFLGYRVTGVSGLVSASTSFFYESAGDSIEFSIPGTSLDFGVPQANAIPEPSAVALLGIGVAAMLVGGLRHRTGRRIPRQGTEV